MAGALAIVSGLAPEERWGRIVETITDPARLVVRTWTGGAHGDYSQEKIAKQLRGIFEIDWDAEHQIVLAEPFMSYTVMMRWRWQARPDSCPISTGAGHNSW